MSRPLRNPKVGDLAYNYGSPVTAGVVVELVSVKAAAVFGLERRLPGVRIRRTDGSEYETSTPQSFEALLESSRRKLESHETKLAELKKLRKELLP